MGSFVPLLGDWFWWVVAGVLLLLELMAPGMFFFHLATDVVGSPGTCRERMKMI